MWLSLKSLKVRIIKPILCSTYKTNVCFIGIKSFIGSIEITVRG